MDYEPLKWEAHWREEWSCRRLYETGLDEGPVFYNLVEFPYPSAKGLHVGNVRTYVGADVAGRFERMRGHRVFQPIGFDAFGIHTENYALKTDTHPKALTGRTIRSFGRQLQSIGAAWDHSREVVTSDPSYYRWTQWLFLRLHEAGLAYRSEAPVVWCPSCRTVLAHEQLEGSACERCGTEAAGRVMTQWFLGMTAYADALADGLDDLDWPAWAKRQQLEWIGRSHGADVDFLLDDGSRLSVFTTRVDTLPGVTFLAVGPSHPLAGGGVQTRVDSSRFAASVEGRDTGVRAAHPLTGERIPVWVAEYVVSGYGTGCVMGVPAHDERDGLFAAAHGLPAKDVATDGSEAARDGVLRDLESRGLGRRTTRYRLRDWLISRQRYWGPPIPIVHCDGCGEVRVPDDRLPVLLPDIDDVSPPGTGQSPLAACDEFVRTSCPSCGGPARRETDVSDTFFDSAWYFLRYTSTDRDDVPWDPARVARVMPVDRYEGGREHVCRHHLYARFVCHALHDLGLLPFKEPFPRVVYHGLIELGSGKMSKSKGNVVWPDPYVETVGADVLRLALLFAGPWEEGGVFSDDAVSGMVRFTKRIWRLTTSPASGRGIGDVRMVDRTIDRVTREVAAMKLNTAIAGLMEYARWAEANHEHASPDEWDRIVRTLILLAAPFAPHLAEELWARLGGEFSVHGQTWPAADPDALRSEEVTLVVQVDGRTRGRVMVAAGAAREQAVEAALRSDGVQRHLGEAGYSQVVFVPDRLVNFVRSRD